MIKRPQNNGYMPQNYDNNITDDDDLFNSDIDVSDHDLSHSRTGTEPNLSVQFDSPYKADHIATIPDINPVNSHKNTHIELHPKNVAFNDEDDTKHDEDSDASENIPMEITRTKAPPHSSQKNGYKKHKNGYYQNNENENKSDTFLQYKTGALHQYLFLMNNCMFFKFKQEENEKSFTFYINKQYDNYHALCIFIMIAQIILLHFYHISFAVNTNLYIMIAFVAVLCILFLFTIFTIICSFCWHNKYKIRSMHVFSFCVSLGTVLLYLIILYAIYGSLTTDKFLIYFVLTLTFNTCVGYITFTQYLILSSIVVIEFTLCVVLRWQQIITIGIEAINGTNKMTQVEGIITEKEFYFSLGVVIFTFLYKGYAIYTTQKQLLFEYIQTLQIVNEYVRDNKIKFSTELRHILGVSSRSNIYEEQENNKRKKNSLIDTKHISPSDDDISQLSSLQANNININLNIPHSSASSSGSSGSSDIDVQTPQNNLDSPINYEWSTTDTNIKSPLHNFINHNRTNTQLNINGSNNFYLDKKMDNMERIQFINEPQEVELELEYEEYKDESTSVQDQDDESFGLISLISTCKYVCLQAGTAIREVYKCVDNLENIKYSETRSFSAIEQQRMKNQQRLNAAKMASKRGLKLKNKKKNNIEEGDRHGSFSPFKEKLPPFIKNTKLFDLNPTHAAASLSNSIIVQSLHTHFPQIKHIKHPTNGIRAMETDIISPRWIDINACKKQKLKSENGQDIKREMIQNHAHKWQYFNELEPEDLVIWVQALEGTKAMKKNDNDTQRCVTVLIGIADRHKRRPIAGIIHCPFSGETVIGIPDVGTWPYNFTVSNMSHSKYHSKRIVIAKYQHSNEVKQYLNTNRACKQRDMLGLEGGMGNNVLLLMQNEYDVFLHADHEETYKWDTCACEAVILSLGGDFTQLDGKELEYTDVTTKLKKGFVATLYGTEYHKQFQYKEQF